MISALRASLLTSRGFKLASKSRPQLDQLRFGFLVEFYPIDFDVEVWTCVPGGKDSQPLKRKGLKNAVLQDDAALQVSKFFENPLGACMYFAQKKRFHPQLPCNLQN